MCFILVQIYLHVKFIYKLKIIFFASFTSIPQDEQLHIKTSKINLTLQSSGRCPIRLQCKLKIVVGTCALCVYLDCSNSILCNLEISFVFFNSNKLTIKVFTSYACRSRPHCKIQHCFAFIGVGFD